MFMYQSFIHFSAFALQHCPPAYYVAWVIQWLRLRLRLLLRPLVLLLPLRWWSLGSQLTDSSIVAPLTSRSAQQGRHTHTHTHTDTHTEAFKLDERDETKNLCGSISTQKKAAHPHGTNWTKPNPTRARTRTQTQAQAQRQSQKHCELKPRASASGSRTAAAEVEAVSWKGAVAAMTGTGTGTGAGTETWADAGEASCNHPKHPKHHPVSLKLRPAVHPIAISLFVWNEVAEATERQTYRTDASQRPTDPSAVGLSGCPTVALSDVAVAQLTLGGFFSCSCSCECLCVCVCMWVYIYMCVCVWLMS